VNSTLTSVPAIRVAMAPGVETALASLPASVNRVLQVMVNNGALWRIISQ